MSKGANSRVKAQVACRRSRRSQPFVFALEGQTFRELDGEGKSTADDPEHVLITET